MVQATGSDEYGLPTQAGKKKFNPVIVGCFVVVTLLFSSWITSQYLASQFNYSAALGGINHLYTPWAWISWFSEYGDQYPEQFKKGLSAGLLCAGTFIGLLALYRTLVNRNAKKHAHLHGSARWAKEQEIKDMGLLPDEGVYVGAYKDKKGKVRYLRHNGPEHILCFAPTRSGKGIGLVLPTLLSWKESAFILDIKGENWALTSGWRSKYAKNKCVRFDPSNPTHSDRFNPLEEIRVGTQYEVGDAQNLALMLVDPLGKGLNDHWSKTAFSLLTGVILYECYLSEETGEHTNLPKLAQRLSDPNQPIDELWEEMWGYTRSPVVQATGRTMMDTPDDERGSTVSTAKSFLSLYVDPVVSKNVEKSDFKIRDFMNGENPMSIYLVINPADKGRLMPLIRIVLSQTIRTLVEKMEFKDGRSVRHYKHRLLLMLDEFASLGKIEILEEALHYMAGYGLKGYLIAQDVEQIRSRERGYGTEETVTSGCHIKNAFAPNKPETAKYLSEMCGDTTVTKQAITTSGKRTGVFLGNVSRTFQEVKRPLLTPDECRRLPGAIKNAKGEVEEAGDMLISVAGFPVVYGKQILYFKDDTFMKRAQVPALGASPVYLNNEVNQVIDATPTVEPESQLVEEEPRSTSTQEPEKEPEQPAVDISDYMEEEPQENTDDSKNGEIKLDF